MIHILTRVGFRSSVLDSLSPGLFRVPVDDHPFLNLGLLLRADEVRPALFLRSGSGIEVIGHLVPNGTGGVRFAHTHLGACWLGLKLGAAYLARGNNTEKLKEGMRALGFRGEALDYHKFRE